MRNWIFVLVLFFSAFFVTHSVLFAAGEEVGSSDPFSQYGSSLSAMGVAFPAKVTCYAPGADPTIEGPFATSRPNANGQNTPMTLDCVRLGQCKYVTLAANPEHVGKFFYIGTFKYRSPIDGNWYTLENLVGFVHDRGSAFDERQCAQYNTCGVMKRKMDVAVGDFRDPKWRGGAGSRFVDSQPMCGNVDAQWRQLTGAPTNFQTTVSGTQPGGPIQALNQMTGGALGNSPLGQFLGLQPTQSQPQQQTPINGVSGGSVAPTYSGIGGTSAGAIPTTGSIPSVSGAGVSANAPSTNTPTVSLPLTDAVLGGDTLLTGTTNQATTTASQTINLNAPLGPIKNAPPTLLCIPGVVEPNEEALLFWSCNDASTSAEVDASTDESCETLGKTSGVMCARPASSTTYTLACNAGTSAQCLIQVIQPRLAIIATPRSVVRGGVVDITWDTDDVSDCVVKSSTHPTFNRVGINGDVTSPSMYQDTTFTLLCEAETGTIKKKEIVVDVL